MHFHLVWVTSHDQLYHRSLDKKAPPERKLIYLCGRCSIMTSEFMAPYIHLGGYTVTHLSVVYVPETPLLTHCSILEQVTDIRKRTNQDQCRTAGIVLQLFPDIFRVC